MSTVADYVGKRYLSPDLITDLEQLAAEMVAKLISGELKSGVVGLQLAGTLDKDANPELTLTITDTRKRQRRYDLSEAYQMRLPFGEGE